MHRAHVGARDCPTARTQGVPHHLLARWYAAGATRQVALAVCLLPRPCCSRRRHPARALVAADGVAPRRESTHQVCAHDAAAHDEQEANRAHLQRALPDRARLRGDEGRTWTRPLRGPVLPRLASPRLGGPLLLRLRHRRAHAAFPPLVPTAKCPWYAPARGLNATSRIPSRPSVSPSPASWLAGCRDAPSANARCPGPARLLPLPRSGLRLSSASATAAATVARRTAGRHVLRRERRRAAARRRRRRSNGIVWSMLGSFSARESGGRTAREKSAQNARISFGRSKGRTAR